MSPFTLLMRSDAAAVLAGMACLVGWLAGVGLTLAIYWRRITHRDGGELRLLRMAVDDKQAECVVLRHRADELARVASDYQRIIDGQTAQIAALYKNSERLARRYVEAAATEKAPAPHGRAIA